MNVSACIATRGDVDMQPILNSLPAEWEKIVWVNGGNIERHWWQGDPSQVNVTYPDSAPDRGPYGRFAAIEYASHDLIYVQDDDVIVSDPQAIVDRYLAVTEFPPEPPYGPDEVVVCNMPQEFRPHYPDSAMVGFGAAFHRDAPTRAFDRFRKAMSPSGRWEIAQQGVFLRESCRIFTVLTPRVLVDVPKTDMPYASDPNRLWKQPDHVAMRELALSWARKVRDA